MKYIRINEKKWATIILLEKIKDMYSFENAHSGKEWGEKDAYNINEFITLDRKDYKIGHDIFVETLANLEADKLIRLLDHMTFSINEIVKDPLEYALEERKINSLFSEKDLDNDDVFEYEIAIKDLPKIKKKIKELNLLEISSDKISNQSLGLEKIPTDNAKLSDKYEITLKDREIWINNYLISKPHSIGSNMEFFRYLFENPNKLIKRSELPEYVIKEIGTKKFSKMLNGLGFVGEILKAFFPKSGKTSMCFIPAIYRKDFEKRGVDETIFLKELDLAHSKKSSK